MSDIFSLRFFFTIHHVDISEEGKLILSGDKLDVVHPYLKEIQYTTPPDDGIWGYTLGVSGGMLDGGPPLTRSFSIEAPWSGDINANGVRINLIFYFDREYDTVITLLKAKKVEKFTSEQPNAIDVKSASYDKEKDQLIIDVSCHGGDNNHLFALEWDGLKMEGTPPQYNLNLVDLSELDQNDELKAQQLRFDISTPDVQLSRPAIINIRLGDKPTALKVEIE